ncbi:MAG: universal stress protein E [Gammaproteobacteria bacterium]|jgi:universal stress protein E
MDRFKKILFVHGENIGSDDALSRATELAQHNAACLTLVEVVTDSTATPDSLKEREKKLARLQASVQFEGVDADVVVLAGTPFLEIIRKVLRDDHDLVIMAADGSGDLRQMLFGSTSMHLMRKCPCPVWVLKAPRSDKDRKILAAIAWPDDKPKRDELNVAILDFATSLARAEGSELQIVHAWDFVGADADTMRSETTVEIRDRLFEKNEMTHRDWLLKLLGSYDLEELDCHVQVLHGPVEPTLANFVNENMIDLVVMGSLRRTGIPGFLIGSTAEYVLGRVNCSVLTKKPTGFQTPVTLNTQE